MPYNQKTKKLLTIQVDDLRLRAYIGYLDWEKEKLQDIILSFSFKYNGNLATLEDNVQHAINYKHLTKEIINLVEGNSFQLIETLAEKLYQHIQQFSSMIEEIHVKVEKPQALRFADNVLVKISSKDRYTKALIGLGSNIEPETALTTALERLTKLGKLLNRTAFIKTKALKFEEQEDFLNAGVLIETNLSKPQLNAELKQIEVLMGRVRTENKNAARIIDLDIVTFNEQILDPEELVELPFIKQFIAELQPDILKSN